MTGADIKAGKAFVELYLKNNLLKGLGVARKQLDGFAKSATKIGSGIMRIGARVSAVGSLFAGAFIAPIKAAGDLAETTSKFGAIFGDQTDDATKWLDNFTASVGRGKKEAMDGMSAFGAFFAGMGSNAAEAAELSKKMTALAVDFGSFHNVTDTEAQERFISALSGSGQVLDMFGINIKQSALDLKLLEMGFPSIAKGADETQKVLARMSIIEESMGRQGAVGDAVRTADSFSNQLKKLRGQLMDTAAVVGNALLPVVTPMVTQLSKMAAVFAKWAENNSAAIVTAAKLAIGIAGVGVAITGVGAALYGAGIAATAASVAFGITAAMLAAIVSPIGLIATALTAGAVLWLRYTESGQAAIAILSEAIAPFVATFQQAFAGIKAALMDGNLQLAGQIAFAGLVVAWETAKLKLLQSWVSTRNFLLGFWDEIGIQFQGGVAFLGSLVSDLAMGFSHAFKKEFATIGSLWSIFQSGAKIAFEAVSQYVAATVNRVLALSRVIKTAIQLAISGAQDTPEAKRVQTAVNTVKIGKDIAASEVKEGFDLLLGRANAKRDKAIADARAGLGARDDGGVGAQNERVRAAQERLDELTRKAAEAIAVQEVKKNAGKNDVDNAAAAGAQKAGIKAGDSQFGSFSGAALAAIGAGGIQQRQLAEQKKAREEAKLAAAEQKKQMEKLREAVKDNQLQVVA